MKLKNALIITLMIIAFFIITNSNIFAKTVIVDTDTLRLREEASKDADTIKLLDNGQKLEYLDEDTEWYKVKVDGKTGYVSKDYTKLQEDEKDKTTEETTAEAVQPEESTEEQVKEQNQTTEPKEQPVVAEQTEMKLAKDSNVYILPLINANTIQNIKKDSNVKILSRTNGWVYVETDEVMGWLRQDTLIDSSVVSDDIDTTTDDEVNTDTEKEEEKTDTDITSKIMYVNSSSIYVRKGPETTYDVVDTLVLNDTVKVVAENGDWYKVEVAGNTGYIAKRLLSNSKTETTTRSDNNRNASQEETNTSVTTNSTSSKGQQVVDFAKQYLGRPYVYGASGPNSFDCSGFTMYVFKNFGINLSHSATAQSNVGTEVSKENLQAGDLVFFTDYPSGVGIGHCGIYIGNGDFIHASSGTGYCVKISTLLTGSYYNRYETARRIY